MMIIKRLFAFLQFLIFPSLMIAQKQANIWHFGNGHALDFNSGSPVQLSGSAMESFEGSASYCDALGNLLFYTNGGGREPLFSGQDAGHIWNRNNAVMYDMQGTQGGGFSAAQSSVIFEAPAQPDVFYVFTMEELEFSIGASPATTAAQPQGRGLRYFTVDMNLNAGLGGVVLADQPVYLPSFEGLCAIRHANQQDYWVLINQDSTGIGIYRVDPSGVSFSGNYTAIGGTSGIIKASPDGQRVKVGAYLLNFNNSNGTLSNPLNLGAASEFFEFSPNSNFLYEAANATIFQYDLQAASIPASATAIGTVNNSSGFGVGQMQLAPDGRIYFLTPDLGQNNVIMGRINCPNDVAASLQQGLFTFPGFFIGLPNFPAWIFESDNFTAVSLGADTLSLCDVSVGYTLDAQNPGATYLWSTGATTQQIFVGSPGTYSVTVLGPCGTGTDQVVITACPPPVTDCLVFEYTGVPQQWTVPPGVDSIRVQMWGAAGGGGPDFINNNGGSGGYTEVTLPVVAGDFLEIVVGGGGAAAQGHIGGAGGYAGGGDGGSGNRVETIGGVPTEVGGAAGGGGLTVVRMQGSITNILGIAGGGGGGALNRPGGAGGGLEAEYTVANNGSSLSGFGGTQTAGGAPSDNPFCPHPVLGTPGAGQQGGTGATDLGGIDGRVAGGGGGSGYFGGGGGGSQDGCFGVGSPGGGGSGFVCTTCNGLYGFTETGGLFGTPPNSNDPIFQTYPQTATGAVNQNGGNGLVQICFLTGCAPVADTIALSACSSFTDPLGNQYTQSGTYSYTLTAASGCDSTVVLNLTILPVLQTQLTITACDSFVADDGAIYYQSTVLSDTLTASTGCDSVVTVQLTVGQSVVTPVQNITACASYTAPWGVVYTQSGVYTDTLLSAGGCDSIVAINLTISSVPALAISIASADSCEQSAVSFSLSPAQPVISVDWQFDDPGSGAQNISTALSPQHQFSAPGTYTVQSIVERDCGTDTLLAQLIIVACDDTQQNCALYVPNAFSPNGDGSNDRFSPEANCPYEVFSLQVFNRWGGQVFQTFNPGTGWDGTYRQEVCPVGVYVYTFRYRFANLPTNYLQGSVTLVR